MPKLIKDLGLEFYPPSNKRVHFAIYLCPDCSTEFRAKAYKDLTCRSSTCKPCATRRNASIHGHGKKPLYKRFQDMVRRCYNKTHKDYPFYGGRGVKICDEWLSSYESFESWALASGFEERLTIERIENDKGYYPDNCRWATSDEQKINRRLFKNSTTGFRGVGFHKANNKYTASIGINKKNVYLGSFDTAEEAAKARDKYIEENSLPHPKNF